MKNIYGKFYKAGWPVIISLLAALFGEAPLYGQITLVRITDSTNPIISDQSGGYAGATWVDYNGDGWEDLYINRVFLYRNNGGGNFSKITTTLGGGQVPAIGNGNSWGDYDNDGDPDAFCANPESYLYRNDGSDLFTRIDDGVIGNSFANRGWACAWGDYNNDGYLDLYITLPAGFLPAGYPDTTSHLFLNDGPPNFTFSKIDTGAVVTGLAPYTVGTWSDYDQDGDIDLFVGSGPASNFLAPDNLYKNMLKETGSAYFTRITDSPIATDPVDGQVWNWIDYDNDGDLDAYLTNWGGGLGGVANNLYRNNGDNTFQRMTAAEVGSIAGDVDISLASSWGDYDNDGDLDCFVSNDANQVNRLYANNGDGTFSPVTGGTLGSDAGVNTGLSNGDYDNDGRLDIFVMGNGVNRFLYHNETQNGYHWIKIRCKGIKGDPSTPGSNRSGIGAMVQARALIGGSAVNQLREVSAQNSFNGHNSLTVHFGLKDATLVDTLKIRWPSGIVDVYTDVAADQYYEATENTGLIPLAITSLDDVPSPLAGEFELRANYPNPFNPSTNIGFRIADHGSVELKIYDITGQWVRTLVSERKAPGDYTVQWDGTDHSGRPVSAGIYLYRLRAGKYSAVNKMLLVK